MNAEALRSQIAELTKGRDSLQEKVKQLETEMATSQQLTGDMVVALRAAREMLVSIQQGAQPVRSFDVAKSIGLRLDWCALTLRTIADRGRPQLGDSYPEILSVLGAVNASRECLEQLKP